VEIRKNTLVIAFDVVVDHVAVADMGFCGEECVKEDLFATVRDVQREEKTAEIGTEKGCFIVPLENIIPLVENVPEKYEFASLAVIFRQLLPEIIKTIARSVWAMEQTHKPV